MAAVLSTSPNFLRPTLKLYDCANATARALELVQWRIAVPRHEWVGINGGGVVGVMSLIHSYVDGTVLIVLAICVGFFVGADFSEACGGAVASRVTASVDCR